MAGSLPQLAVVHVGRNHLIEATLAVLALPTNTTTISIGKCESDSTSGGARRKQLDTYADEFNQCVVDVGATREEEA